MKKLKQLLLTGFSALLFTGLSSQASAQTYCTIPTYVNNSSIWITNVTFAGINQSSGANPGGYGNYTTGTVGNVTIGTASTLSVSIVPYTTSDDNIRAFIDWNQNGSFTDPGENYAVASGIGTNGPFSLSITPPAAALTGNTRMRVIGESGNFSNGSPCMQSLLFVYGEAEDYTINVQGSSPLNVDSVDVRTVGNVAATISTNAGTLAMTAQVFPATASQAVTWSIVPGTGTATISTTGLVTAQTNGTVWAKAVSVASPAKKDSMQVTISNQVVPVTSLTVATQGSVPATITTNGGTLQMTATVLPATASQAVTWSIVPGTGTATISTTGLVTAQTNGTVWAKAVSVANAAMKDSMQVTISNQVVPVTSLTVATQGSVPATITANGGTLQMTATVLPATANQSVTWSIVPGTGTATISTTGLVTAQTNGTVWAKAVSVSNAAMKDSMQVTISNQRVGVGSLNPEAPVLIYPNPANDLLFVYVTPAFVIKNAARLSLFNNLGQLVSNAVLKAGQHTLDLSSYPAGTYHLKIENADDAISYQVLKK